MSALIGWLGMVAIAAASGYLQGYVHGYEAKGTPNPDQPAQD